MRTPSNATIQYAPGDPPVDAVQLQRFLRNEFALISAAISALAAGHLDMVTVAPSKPRNGDVRYADGTSWNPGGGKGIYMSNGSVWTLIIAIP